MKPKKSQKASLENNKFTYALIGFVFVLSICFVVLEWSEGKVTKHNVVNQHENTEEDLDVVPTKQETPPPPPPPQEIAPDFFKPVEDDKEVKPIDVVPPEDNSDVIILPPVLEREVETEIVEFVKVEKKPEFPGGEKAMFRYIAENVKYPSIAAVNGIQGKVTCQFVVSKDGSIVDVVVVRSSGDESLDREAVRVIKSMPKWKPGCQQGRPVCVNYTLPIKFRLQ